MKFLIIFFLSAIVVFIVNNDFFILFSILTGKELVIKVDEMADVSGAEAPAPIDHMVLYYRGNTIEAIRSTRVV